MEYGPPYGKWTPIPTLILLHITLILLRIMYINFAFPNLKHCKNKCLPVFLKIKKKNGPIQKHNYTKSGPPIKLSVLLFWYLEGLIA